MASPRLVSEKGEVIQTMHLTAQMIINRSISIYGATGSGKTAIVKHILDLLIDEVDQALIVSPTESANMSFKNYIPQPLIHYNMSMPDPKFPNNASKRLVGNKGALAFIKTVWDRQDMLTQTYNTANKPETLQRLFNKVATAKKAAGLKDLKRAKKTRDEFIQRLEERKTAEGFDREEALQKVEERYTEMKGKLYKKYVGEDINRMWKMYPTLTTEEKWALHYFELNPKMVIIFDDCADELKSLGDKPEFKALFYKNRHVNLTVIFCFQDDTDLKTPLRKNSYLSIFCTSIVCTANFCRPANNYPKQVKQRIEDIAAAIYGEHAYTKLLQFRDDPKGVVFYRFRAPRAKNKMFCSTPVKELCEGVVSGDALRTDNPYYETFQPPE
jgi:energy-coupling factor transporter ATP-binding protein EcfA2